MTIMTIRDIINQLRQTGNDVSFYVRKDGGVRITKINGQSFSGSAGNVKARLLVGATLSEARRRQLSKIAPTESMKGKGTYNKRRRRKLTSATEKEIARLQRLRRERIKRTGEDIGMVSKRNYRWVMEHYGKREADRLLKEAELYLRGIAYTENVNAFISRLTLDMKKLKQEEKDLIQKIIDKLETMKGVLKESVLQDIYDEKSAFYQWEKGTITTQEFYRQIMEKLNKN